MFGSVFALPLYKQIKWAMETIQVASINIEKIVSDIQSGELVPYLGAGALSTVSHAVNGSSMPADSDSLILAMTGGTPMAPRLMYEFPRAAMHMENKKGRSFIERFLQNIYGDDQWSKSSLHLSLNKIKPPYIIDTNRDMQLPVMYEGTPHTLIVGVARIAAHPLRFDIYEYADGDYKPITQEQLNTSLPIIFKPLGCPLPKPSYVASDADFVDYITELMGGFAIPTWLKSYRQNKQYVFLGMRFTRDTERMVMKDMIYAANPDLAGYAFIAEPTDKERKFLANQNVEIIEQDWQALFSVDQATDSAKTEAITS